MRGAPFASGGSTAVSSADILTQLSDPVVAAAAKLLLLERSAGIQAITTNTTVNFDSYDLVWLQLGANDLQITLSASAPAAGSVITGLLVIQQHASSVKSGTVFTNVSRYDGVNVEPLIPSTVSDFIMLPCFSFDGSAWYVHSNSLVLPTSTIPLAYLSSTMLAVANSPGSASFTANKPSGAAEDDLLIAFVGSKTIGYPTSAPSGWTALDSAIDAGSGYMKTYKKVLGASEAASYTWGFASAGGGDVAILCYRGTNVDVDVSGLQANASSTICTCPSVTAVAANDFQVVACLTSSGLDQSQTTPSGFTFRQGENNGGKPGLSVFDKAITATGATGTTAVTIEAATPNVGVTIAVKGGS